MPVPSLDVAVVGGSIAGCCAALELTRAGHRVEIFERSAAALLGNGSAIGLPPETFNAFLKRDLVDESMPRLSVRGHVLLTKSAGSEPLGREVLRLPTPVWSTNWTDLYRNLRKRVADNAFHAGVKVQSVQPASDAAELCFEDGSRRSFELVCFADGHASIGRSVVCPDALPTYRGYVLWRGVLDAAAFHDVAPLDATICRIAYRGAPGHAVAYLTPSGATTAGSAATVINFGCYRAVSTEELAELLVDRQGRRHLASLRAGELRREEEQHFKAFAVEHLPGRFADIMVQARDTFLQPIFGARVSRQHVGRICLLGDAAALVPPITGSGVMKAALHANGLARQLQRSDDIATALAAWDTQQTALGQRLSDLSEHLERTLIWNMPDFDQLDAPSALRWWQHEVMQTDTG